MLPRKHIISCTELCRRWNTDFFGLSYLILKYDITILDYHKIPRIKFFFNPNDYRIDTAEVLNIIQKDPRTLEYGTFWLPEIEKLSASGEISNFKSKNWSDLLHSDYFEKGLFRLRSGVGRSGNRERDSNPGLPTQSPLNVKPKEPEIKKKPCEILIDVIEEHEGDIRQHSNVFSLIGKVWYVKFKQKEWGLYPDQEKYKYIANFLKLPAANPDQKDLKFSIYNTELVETVKGKDISKIYPNFKKEIDMNVCSLTDELSPEEVDRFKDHGYDLLTKLNEANDSGDTARIKDTQNRLDKYRLYLLNEYGIKTTTSDDGNDIYFKRLFRSNRENEKIRQLIKNHTNNAIRDFNDRMPSLRKHLESSINPKLVKSTYTPETYYNWHVSM